MSEQAATIRRTSGPNSLDAVEHRLAALVFGSIVQQRGDRLVLGAAVIDHERSGAEQMPDVRSVAALPRCLSVHLVSEHQRFPNRAL